MRKSEIRRIVSVCPSNTGLCAHLGVLGRVVARDSWSDWPEEEVKDIEVIGNVLRIDVERVVELKPDLILASLNVPGMEKVVPKLRDTGLPVVVYDPESWQDVLDNLLDLGKRLDLDERAEAVVGEARRKVEGLQRGTSGLPWVTLCVEWWPKPVIVPCGKTYVNQVLSWVKVKNPFDHYEDHRSGQPPMEEIVQVNPDMYCVSWCGTPWVKYSEESVVERYSKFLNSEQAAVLSPLKIKEEPKRVFKLWEGEIGHPSLRLLDGATRVLEQRKALNI